MKRTPLKQVSRKQAVKNRELAKRKGEMLPGWCGVCKWWVTQDSGTLHHIKRRSQGGDHSPENLLIVHHDCHRKIHDNVQWAIDNGYLCGSARNPKPYLPPSTAGRGRI